jgi:hypothetical protein
VNVGRTLTARDREHQSPILHIRKATLGSLAQFPGLNKTRTQAQVQLLIQIVEMSGDAHRVPKARWAL